MSLKVENLSFSYENGGRHVLTRISLKIEPGERVGLGGAERIWKNDAVPPAGGI